MSDSVQPHRRQPTRLRRPWDSPGKNTGVGCHFLLQCMKMKSESEVAQSCPTLWHPMDCSPPGSSIHGIIQARVLEWGAISFSAIYATSDLYRTYQGLRGEVNTEWHLCIEWQTIQSDEEWGFYINFERKNRIYLGHIWDVDVKWIF